MIDVTYGNGKYIHDRQVYSGQIILSEYKLFIRRGGEDIIDSYLPLDKITCVRLAGSRVWVHVKPTLYFQYTVEFQGSARDITSLAHELVSRRGLKKKWLRREWNEEIQ